MKLIGLIGKKQSGKNTFAELLASCCKALPDTCHIQMAFGDALKEELSVATGMPVEAIEREKARFRAALQWWGTEFRREMFGQDYWICRLRESKPWRLHELSSRSRGLTIVTDVRFPDEAQFLRDNGAALVTIHRPDLPKDAHVSEGMMDHIKSDITICNNASLGYLRSMACMLVPQLMEGIQ